MSAGKKNEPAMVRLLYAFRAWVDAGCCMIRPKIGAKLIPLQMNRAQKKLWQKMVDLAVERKPIRIIVLKPRQIGSTTWCQALAYFIIRAWANQEALMLAHVAEETRKIFKIAKRIRENDHDRPDGPKPKQNSLQYFHPGGGSAFEVRTGGGHYAASGTTLSMLIIGELSKWKGTANAIEDQIASLVGGVPTEEGTIIIIDATANKSDSSGEYRRRWAAAQSGKDDFVPVFFPWLEHDEYRVPGASVPAPLDDDEVFLRDQCGADDEQLAWRRKKIRHDFNGRADLFKQEYPATPEEAFQAHRGTIFPRLRAERHGDWSPTVSDLMRLGYSFYRGIDWGASDPFCSLIVAHKEQPLPRYSVDLVACPNHWREMVGYVRDDKGRPVDRDNHSIDSLRYIVKEYNLTGHVHVFREIYIEHSAHQGYALPDLAKLVRKQREDLPELEGSVADRSRPDSINLFNQLDEWVSGYSTPGSIYEGFIEDGLTAINALIVGVSAMAMGEPEETWEEQEIRTREGRGIQYVETDVHHMLAVEATMENQAGDGFQHPFFEDGYAR